MPTRPQPPPSAAGPDTSRAPTASSTSTWLQPGTASAPTANPETLFAAGYSACFQGALANRAKTQDIDTSASTVTANVSFGPSEDGGFGIAVALEVHVPDLDLAKVQELADLAHQFCPYSKATRGNIEVTVTAV